METVRTFSRYRGITGSDPFDDLRILEYYEKLVQAGLDADDFIVHLATMASALDFARGNEDLANYELTYEFYGQDGEELTVMQLGEKVVMSFAPTSDADIPETESLDNSKIIMNPLDEIDRLTMKSLAFRRRETVMMLLNNAIQVGVSLDVLLNMEYMQAVSFVNMRAEELNKQQKASKSKSR